MIVANDIIKRIFDGEYRPGSKLPSMRTLAKRYGVSVQVILSAFQGLQSFNYIESRPKQGVYVSSDIRSARFYRVGVFVMNQNPLVFGGILYPLYNALEKAGYCMIMGMNFDNGLHLKQWISHKRNLDGLIILGTPTAKQLEQYKKIKIPYVYYNAPVTPVIGNDSDTAVAEFAKWFVNTYLDHAPEKRPVFLHKADPVAERNTKNGNLWTEYQPEVIYGFGTDADGKTIVMQA